MQCPHCQVEVNPAFQEKYLGQDSVAHWSIFFMICPNTDCRKFVIKLNSGNPKQTNVGVTGILNVLTSRTIWPLTSNRPQAPKEVDKPLASDYNEACLIISFSPKASAALSRRCLQNILREKAKVKKGDLAGEIQQAIDSGILPSYLIESIDAIRNIGNFAAHPMKSTATGEIVDVEPGEAEWLLDVLESLFDFYFVQPALLKAKKDALNVKLNDLGKPSMK